MSVVTITTVFAIGGSVSAVLDERIEGTRYHQKGDLWADALTLVQSFEPFSAEENAERDAAEAAAAVPPVPRSVTPYQARRALTNAGLRDQIEAFVLTLDQAAQDAWQYGLAVERNNPMIAAAAVTLGMTEAEIDDLFRAAAAL